MNYNKVTLTDFAEAFGIAADDLPSDCKSLIAETDFRYRRLSPEERDKLILYILKTIEEAEPSPKRRPKWEEGWSENLQSFTYSGYNIEALIPKYIRSNQPIRLGREYVIPRDANFEHLYAEVFRLWLFQEYFQSVGSVYDFGCGTGYNLAVLARLFPSKKLHGLDWTTASQRIVNKIAEVYKYNISGLLFDMFSPDESLEIADNSAVMTFAALEQMGGDYEAFLQFILRQAPVLCVNVEPFFELYDESNLVDRLAIKYHKKRNYLYGYLSRLKQLESEDRITISKVQRLRFGNQYHEAYSYVVWQPKGGG